MTSFHERQKSLFNQLKEAEDQCSFSKSNNVQDSAQDCGVVDRKTYRKVKYTMKQFRGKESIFKRPEATIRECLRTNSVPGYVKNPKNWVYYSLSDVTPEQMSDSTNTSTALTFLREMEDKEAGNSKMETDNPDDFVFKKPTFHMSSIIKKATNTNDDRNVTVIKYNKVIMPEYVVGVSKKKEKNNRVVRRNPLNNSDEVAKKADLKLDHLYGDDEAD